VIEALVQHFCAFTEDGRTLPVIWHQALLVLAQRYKLEFSENQKERLKILLKAHVHHQITVEIRREIFGSTER
jgi:essential nuclear protein 1